MSANESLLIPNGMHGWRMGLANMLAKENAAWWRTRRWWLLCLLALVLLNGNIALNVRGSIRIMEAALAFLQSAAFIGPIVAVSLGQDAILGERHSGTAAWVLSKPLRRPAFVLAKLGAHAPGLLATCCMLPGVVAYYQLTTNGLTDLPLAGFAAAMGLVYLSVLFYLTLAVMLATLFDGRGPVLGITLGVLFSAFPFATGPILKLVPGAKAVMPWLLLSGVGSDASLPECLALGKPLPTTTPIIATALWCVLFAVVAIWRFHREEF